MKNQFIVYMFSRREIQSADTSRFLESFRPGGTPPVGHGPLVEAMGNVMFAVDGYDDEPENIYAISEIRAFLNKIHMVWPCWLFFSELQSENLRVLTLCMLEEIVIVRQMDEPLSQVTFSPKVLQAWLRQGMPAFQFLCRKAGLRRPTVTARLREVGAYFGVQVQKFYP
jgi:hypothetical protein